MRLLLLIVCVLGLVAGCARSHEAHRLPTGNLLDPAGMSIELGSMPVSMVFSPDSSKIVTVLSGFREQGFQVIDRRTRRVVQTVAQPAAFLGVCFSGNRLYVSGGNQDLIYVYAWGDSAVLADSIALGPGPGPNGGTKYPAHIATD